MKNRKFLLMVAVMLGLSVTACGGNTQSKSEAPKSEQPSVQPSSEEAKPSSEAPKPSSEQPKPSSEQPKPSSVAPQPSSEAPQPSSEAPQPSSEEPPAPVKAVEVTSVNLVAKESKVYLQLEGTATLYTAAEFKWALALQHAANAGAGDAKDTFILGASSTFADEDYKLDATLNADGSFLFEYNLSTIEGLEAGIYTIHAGVKGLEANLDVGQVNNGVSLKDGTYRFYMRADVGNKNSIAVDELPPVAITEASIVMEEGVAWAKIGGECDESITQEMLDGFDSFVQFQQVGGSWANTRRRKAGTYTIVTPGQSGNPDTVEELVVEKDQYYWKREGSKAFLYADVSFFVAGSNYNTHLNARKNEQADLKMETAIDQHYVMTNEKDAQLDVNIVAVPGASDQDNFWGNLGFKVTAYVDPSAHVHTLVDGTPANNSDGFAVTPFSCSGCNKVGAKMAVASFTGNADAETKTDYKHDNNTTITYKMIAPKAGDYELKIGAFVANNRSKDLTASPYTVKVGDTDVAVSTGTYEELGIGTSAGAQFVLCPTITLAQGENVITITQGDGGYRLTFQGLVEIFEK